MAIKNYLRERFFPHLWCPGCGHGMVLDDGFIYWGDLTFGEIKAVAKDGSDSAMVVAEDLVEPVALAIDADGLYWVDPGLGEIWTIAR